MHTKHSQFSSSPLWRMAIYLSNILFCWWIFICNSRGNFEFPTKLWHPGVISDFVRAIRQMISPMAPSPVPFLLAVVQKINFVPAAAGNNCMIQVPAGQLLVYHTSCRWVLPCQHKHCGQLGCFGICVSSWCSRCVRCLSMASFLLKVLCGSRAP